MVKVDMSPIFVAQPQELHETATSSTCKTRFDPSCDSAGVVAATARRR